MVLEDRLPGSFPYEYNKNVLLQCSANIQPGQCHTVKTMINDIIIAIVLNYKLQMMKSHEAILDFECMI